MAWLRSLQVNQKPYLYSDANGWGEGQPSLLPVEFIPSSSRLKPVSWSNFYISAPHHLSVSREWQRNRFVHRSTVFSFMYSPLKDKRYQRKVPPLHCLSRYEGPCGPCPVKMLRCVNERYPPGGRQWPGPLPKDLPHCFRACRLWRPWAFSLATASLFTEITQFASD